MKDLIEYKNAQISALQRRVYDLEVKNLQLGTWVFELADEDTPKEYKEQVLLELQDYTIEFLTQNNNG